MSFQQLNLTEPLQRALTQQGYITPTPIQLKSIPDLLAGKDLIGIAQTGTGKTAAFVLPILQRMTEKYPRVLRVLVLAPTRELAAQIGDSFAAYGQFLKFKHTVIFGGVGQGPQVNAVSRGVDIVIATPGRLLDLMNQGKVSLKDIEFFVLDEADRMLDMGFIHDIKKIIARLPHKRQSLFFSATMPPQVSQLAHQLLRNPVRVEVAPQATTVESVKQCVFFVDPGAKEKLLLELLLQKHLTRVLVFTRTKHRANDVTSYLRDHNVKAVAIHGNKSQGARKQALENFKSGRTKVLVATDIAARGIDVEDISHVINFELPNEPESYVHRIGRTARAGAEGTAYSFCSAEERDFLKDIERLIRLKLEVMQHAYHSNQAQNAVGSAARPPPRNQRGRGHSRGFRHNQNRPHFSRH
ncbi:DEAD/DEAH box helicase [Candidatus Woesearchaeota archaeon]|nr:DEAD/DEAH box helicase [Candidatus Woesearchaeota archaeon]